ncbi:hypothetical protein VTK73DRAFT_1054 [Phialemonium thermophilum]|uniref:non-specific serine/threonine protein kinase n=1 Tax=Phialemonium thermophilum TaxID=223376 RepID=A0ABR3VU40_9PEZI
MFSDPRESDHCHLLTEGNTSHSCPANIPVRQRVSKIKTPSVLVTVNQFSPIVQTVAERGTRTCSIRRFSLKLSTREYPKTFTMDTMLNVESGPADILYRIQRGSGDNKRMVYVTVTNADLIPEDDRTYGPSAIAQLRKLKEWDDSWTTLVVHKDHEKGIWCEMDVSPPHAVPRERLLDRYPVYDYFSLSPTREVKSRVSEVHLGGRLCFLKIARFPREMPWVIRELQAYHVLEGTSLAPKLVGYVSEGSPDRVVGFLVEGIDGRTAELEDLEPCRRALDQLHHHLVHGDICKYNILITAEGPKFIDFEDSILFGEERWSAKLRDDEKQILAVKLADTSGAGRPW